MPDDSPDLREIEYTGLIAETWDLLRGDTSDWPDRPFYLQTIRQYGEPVLEVGCATGRLLLDFMNEGIDIDGVDNSSGMVAVCRRKAEVRGLTPTLYEQYMETLNLPRRYKTIVISSSSLQLTVEPAQVDRVLAKLLRHLLPGGAVVASIMSLWEDGKPLESTREQTATDEDGVTFRRQQWSRYDPESECEDTEDLYQKIVDDEVVAEQRHQRARATRSYTQAQIKSLFERAGFDEVTLYRAFEFEPAAPEDRVFVVVGRAGV